MNWDAIGVLAELISAVAVVITLAYLAVQLRHSSRSSRLASSQQLENTYQNWLSQLSSDEELLALYESGLRDDSNIDGTQKRRFDILLLQMFKSTDAHYHSYVDGVMSQEMWEATEAGLRHIYAKPGARASWERQKQFLSHSFRAHVEEGTSDT